MDAAELRELSREELMEQLMKLRKEQFNLRLQRSGGQLGQTHLPRETRRDIARLKTVLREMADG